MSKHRTSKSSTDAGGNITGIVVPVLGSII